MRTPTRFLPVLGLAFALGGAPLHAAAQTAAEATPAPAQPEKTTAAAPEAPAPVALAPIVYVPPSRGGAEGRWGAATRGTLPQIEVLAPLQVGMTADAQPTLYWYLGEASEQEIVVMLVDARTEETVLEAPAKVAGDAGIHGFSLKEHGFTLQPGVPYQWIVAMQPDPKRRSYGATAGGVIERRAPVQQTLPPAAPERARALAQAGLWYDAFATLRQDAAGDAAPARQLQRSLLEQVQLAEVAQTLR